MFYELILLVHPDVSMGQIGETVGTISGIVKDKGGRIEASEYWGFRTLAYRIEKRGKAHYVFLGIALEESALPDVYYHLKFNKEVMRYLLVKRPEGLVLPTPLFHSDLNDAIAGIGPSSPVVGRPSPVDAELEQEELHV